MRQQFKDLDTWRGKLTATWICLAPPAAMVAVFVAGGVPANQFVVDSHALSQQRQDSMFDGLAGNVPTQPGVDGSVGTEKRSSIDVPITGATTATQPVISGVSGDASGIPGTVLAAYQKAANDLAVAKPGCHITWPLLAGIGKVESAHASGGRVDAAGNTRGKILGPVLDGGPGMAAISDTDQGRYDGNTQWDRAVGPMQFIPGSWAAFGADGNGDGVKDPHNIFDAARAAGDYLCSGGDDLSNPQGLVQAVLRYNHSMDYVSTVLRWMQSYSKSTVTIPDTPGTIDPPAGDQGNVQKDTTPPPGDRTGADPTSPASKPTTPAQPKPPASSTSSPTVTPTKTLPSTTPSPTTPPWSVTPTKPTTTSPSPSPSDPPTSPSPDPSPDPSTPADPPSSTPVEPPPTTTPPATSDTPPAALPQSDPTAAPNPDPTPTCTPAPASQTSAADTSPLSASVTTTPSATP
jgi:membrane-bound lytic murein transglycosylase B